MAVAGALTLTAAAPGLTSQVEGSSEAAVTLGEIVLAQASGTHTVQRGDTLSDIALANGTTVRALMDANGIGDANLIFAGQTLQLSGAPAGQDSTEEVPAESATHTVQRGEALSVIARQYDVGLAEIAEANGISNPGLIIVGQVLTIPGAQAAEPPASAEPEPATPAPTNATHTVAAGDSLSAIAIAYGTSSRAIAEANGISNPNLVVVGQTLAVPGAAPAPAGPVCPVPGASYVDDYGYVKPTGSVHQGVDLFAPRGAPVLAPVDGTAVHVTGPRGGNQVTFDGDDGARYYMTHLDSFGTAGRVAAGTEVGKVGNTGNAIGTSPHVHFERHVDGEVTDPYPWLTERC